MKKIGLLKLVSVVLCYAFVLGSVPQAEAVLNVPITKSVTVEATVTGTNVLNVAVKNTSDDQAAAKITFAGTTGVATASQYLEVTFNSNAAGARIVIRTDNKNSSIPYTGTGEGAGLVGNKDTTTNAPLLWVVFDDVASVRTFVFTGKTDGAWNVSKEGLVVDKANPNYETAAVLGYATVVVPDVGQGSGDKGLMGNFPIAADAAGNLRKCTSPIYVPIGAGFGSVPAQKYSTSTLALDLIVQ